MFVINCPRHGGRILLSPDNIEALVNTCCDVELHWRCSCGATGVEHIDRAAPVPEAV
jgi:hypothetical protein